MLTSKGEEYIVKAAGAEVPAVGEFYISIYNDTTDLVSKDTDIGDITTEPTGSSFERIVVHTPTNLIFGLTDGKWGFDFEPISFDVSDSTETVDSYLVVATFEADGDSEPTDHLIGVAALSKSYDLGPLDILDYSDGGLTLQ